MTKTVKDEMSGTWCPIGKRQLRAKRLMARQVLERIGHVEFKPETSAKWVDITRSWDGSIRVQIEHDTIKGCTPEMMRWWFENLAMTTTWNGVDFSGPEVTFYHLWHHRDHIAVTPLTTGHDGAVNNGFAPGAVSMIQEQFNDHHFRVEATVYTVRLDHQEFTFLIKKFGLTVGHIVHLYSPAPDGINFYAETKMGFSMPLIGWLLNWLIIPWAFSRKTAENWVKHNIEETGRSEAIIPPLYAARKTIDQVVSKQRGE